MDKILYTIKFFKKFKGSKEQNDAINFPLLSYIQFSYILVAILNFEQLLSWYSRIISFRQFRF